ncbi:MAG: SAM-dependent chlorinase/fluorinase [Polyangiaceae bacterium]
MRITLTTDFGLRDGFVGAMKGVLAELAPSASVIDLAHDLPRGDIAHGAWVVASSALEFPRGTVHVVVVDPGVGGARSGVILEVAGHLFVGPDNGVFGYLQVDQAWIIDELAVRALRPSRTVSSTFHGRDIFAPVAGALASGRAPSSLGSAGAVRGKLPWGPRPSGEGRVVHVDHFGNLVSDLPAAEAGAAIEIAGKHLAVLRTYEDVEPGALLAYVGSMGTIEVAVRDGRADARLSVARGERVIPHAALVVG